MNPGATAAAASGTYSAQAMNAMRATGPVVQVDSHAFAQLVARNREALIVYAPGGALRSHKYLMGFKGLFFATKSKSPLDLPRWVDIIAVRRLHLPY